MPDNLTAEQQNQIVSDLLPPQLRQRHEDAVKLLAGGKQSAADDPTPPPPVAPPPDASAEVEAANQRYRVLQGKYNAEVARFRDEIEVLKRRVDRADQLEREVEALKANQAVHLNPQNPLDAEEFERYGHEFVELTNRFNDALATIEELKQRLNNNPSADPSIARRLDAIEATTARSIQDQYFDEVEERLDAMTKRKGSLAAINADPKWIEWLSQLDPMAGIPRQKLLDSARDSFNVERTMAFFTTYLGANGGKTGKPKAKLADEVLPDATGVTGGVHQETAISKTEFDSAVKAIARGDITPAEFDAIANKYLAARRAGLTQ